MSRASAAGTVYRRGGAASAISTLSVPAWARMARAASIRVRSFIASTNGVDQCAECSAISESVPSLIRPTIALPTSGAISACRTCPHQIRTRQWPSTSGPRPMVGIIQADRPDRDPRLFLEVAGDLIAEEVGVRLLLRGLSLVPDDDLDG